MSGGSTAAASSGEWPGRNPEGSGSETGLRRAPVAWPRVAGRARARPGSSCGEAMSARPVAGAESPGVLVAGERPRGL